MEILLIEDDEALAEMIRVWLVGLGNSVIVAHDGEKAWDQFRRNNIDLVIVDIILPEKDGLELIPQIRKTDPIVGILAISGGGQSEAKAYLTSAKAFGANETLAKPFSADDLREAIRRTVGSGTSKRYQEGRLIRRAV